MRLVFFGQPGAGKGTIAGRLAADLAIPHISTGELFRAAIKKRTPLGEQVRANMDSGALVPDDLTIGLVKERLSEDDVERGFILDGFPRTVPQADALSKICKLDLVLNFVLSGETAVARLSGRRICTVCGHSHHVKFLPPRKEGVCDRCGGRLVQREDDNEASIRKRLHVYQAQTEPLIEYYRDRGLIVSVDGSPNPDVVYASLMKVLKI